MKKLVIIVATVFLSLATVAAWAETGSFNVGPFERGDPFLSSDLKGQVVTGTSKIPEDATVKIIGYTDATGPPDFNKKLAQWRAQEVAEEIKGIAPNVEVTQVKGRPYRGEKGEPNYRMVQVEFSFKTETSPQGQDRDRVINQVRDQHEQTRQEVSGVKDSVRQLEKKVGQNREQGEEQVAGLKQEMKDGFDDLSGKIESQNQGQTKELKEEVRQTDESDFNWKLWTLIVAVFVGIVILVLAIWWFALKGIKDQDSKKKVDDTAPKEEEPVKEEEQPVKEEWVKINSHKIKVEVTKDRIYLPFISSHGDQMYRSSWRDVKKALKGAFKKESFAKQVEQLKKQGKIIKEEDHE